MLTIQELLKNAKVKLYPPIPADDIASLETEIGVPIPTELRTVLEISTGMDMPAVKWDGIYRKKNKVPPFGGDPWFDHPLLILSDECGNVFVIDLSPEASSTAPVYFLCHDPPTITLVARTIRDFLELALQSEDAIDEVADKRSIWTTNPDVMEHAQAMNGDPVLREFASGLDETWQFVDLRNATPGDGFSWGRYGAETKNRRAGREPIFAYQKRKLNWFQRTFGV